MLSLNFVYGAEITYLHKETINASQNLYYYKLDVHAYLVNLQQTLNISFSSWLPNTPPQPQTQTIDGLTAGFTLVIKYLIYVINWLNYIMQIILLTPIKILMYGCTVIMAIFGLDTTPAGQVINAVYTLQMDYIPTEF